MAWRSSGTTNAEMVDKLKRFGVISTDEVERGFRKVDRKFFVPKGNEDAAHSDQPLKEGNVHISAPHIYGSALEALELIPNSSLSFLNIGSGTGYLSCIVAEILGPQSLNYGVEIHKDVIDHSQASIKKWRHSRDKRVGGKRLSGAKSSAVSDNVPHIEIIQGSGLHISETSGESVVGYDRIYIGAAIDREYLPQITRLLSPGGILVGPVDDELVKVVRIGPREGCNSNVGGSESDEEDENSEGGRGGDFTSQVLSGVRFAPLLTLPVITTVIPARVWDPSVHQYFPDAFQKASMELLMCSNSKFVQPPPRPRRPEERVNLAATLPRVVWIEILSFTHRKWFEPEQNETEFLRKRLLEEQANAAKAQQARLEAEARCHVAERERDVYRLLARRWQSRLQMLLQQEGQAGSSGSDSSGATASAGAASGPGAQPANSIVVSSQERAAIFGLGAMLRQMAGDGEVNDGGHNDNGDPLLLTQGSSMEEYGGDEMDEEDEEGDYGTGASGIGNQRLVGFLEEEGESDSDDDAYDFHSLQEEVEQTSTTVSAPKALERDGDGDDSVIMGESDDFEEEGEISRSKQPIERRNQLRTVSMSSEDL